MPITISDINTLSRTYGFINHICYEVEEESPLDRFNLPRELSANSLAVILMKHGLIGERVADDFTAKFRGLTADIGHDWGTENYLSGQFAFLLGGDTSEDPDEQYAAIAAAVLLESDAMRADVELAWFINGDGSLHRAELDRTDETEDDTDDFEDDEDEGECGEKLELPTSLLARWDKIAVHRLRG